jgi:ABC-type phosphate transport system substrate-binding protein
MYWLEERMKRLAIVTVALLAGAACGSGSAETQAEAEPLSQAKKDSIVGSLPVPGASGVLGAMSAVEKANARAQQHDTIG